jgi:chromosome segregation protein
MRQISQTLGGLPLEEMQSQVGHWETRSAVSTRAAADAEHRLADLEQNFSRANGLLTATQQRLAEIHANLVQLDHSRTVSTAEESRLGGEIETLQAQIKPSEADLAEKDLEYQNIQEIDDTAKQGLTVAERYHTQAQLDLTRQRDAVENLRRRIEEDFGLVAFEYAAENPGQSILPFEGMVEQLPALTQLPTELEDNINRIRGQLRRMGAINPDALNEYEGVLERFQFLTTQVADLRKADEDLRLVIDELDHLMKREFTKTFDAVAAEFKQMFTRLFGGGSARLILSDEDHPTETGIDIEARLPGRREQGLSLLSGGERSLTAVALVFSLLKVSPTPFCIMDEVDAMLDEANVGRFRDLLVDLSQATQFIVITHNRNTVQAADVIYGITMGKDSASQMISLRLDEVPEEMVK